MGIVKKLLMILTMVTLLATFVPLGIAQANGAGTTVEVNDGVDITVSPGQVINAVGDGSSGLPLTIKNIPDVGLPTHAFAAFDINITWDPAVIHLHQLVTANEFALAFWSTFTPGNPDTTPGTVKILGADASGYTASGNTGNLTVIYIGFDVVGNPGDSTEIGLTVADLGTDNATPILHTVANMTVTIPGIESISIGPENATIYPLAYGGPNTKQYSVNGTYNVGGTVDVTGNVTFTSSNEAVATISGAGLATAVGIGTTNITANYTYMGATRLDTTLLTVAEPTLQTITVTPANKVVSTLATQQYLATGNYDNGGSANLTGNVTWKSSNTGIATIDAAGLATATTTPGTTTISANLSGVTGSTGLTVFGVTNLNIGPENATIYNSTYATKTLQYVANATLSTGPIVNLAGTANVTWASSNVSVATINAAGLATSVGVGVTTITCNYTATGIVDTTTLTVVEPALDTITVTPANPTLKTEGATKDFTATGNYDSGDTNDLTGVALWESSNTSVATILTSPDPNAGRATSTATPGTTNITATYGGKVGQTLLTTINKWLTNIAVTPAAPSIPKGRTVQFSANGTYDDSSTENVTSTVTWSVIPGTGNATITAGGLATATAVGTVIIKATDSSNATVFGTATLTVNAAVLDTITVIPANPNIALGLNQQFTANGTYSDGSNLALTGVAWTSNSTAVATIGPATGLAVSQSEGTALITASKSGKTGTTVLTVDPPVLQSIAVTPAEATKAKGLTRQFTATGTYTNGTRDVTTEADWTSNQTGRVSIGLNTGLATANGEGRATLTATIVDPVSGTITGTASMLVTPPELLSMTITPNPANKAVGQTQQFVATGNFTDGTRAVTTEAVWSSSKPGVATIQTFGQTNPGLATCYTVGTTTITATKLGVSATATLNVAAAAQTGIVVTPDNPTLTENVTLAFRALSTYADGSVIDVTTSANWSSSNTTVATINPATGVATAHAAGTTTISTNMAGMNDTTTLTVTEATLVSIAVTPAAPTNTAGDTRQFTATGTYTDASTRNLTNYVVWTSNNTAVATITRGSGLATTYAAGTANITATLGSIHGSANLTVTAPVTTSVKVTPVNPTVQLVSGTTQTIQMAATSINSVGTATIVTGTANWSNTGPGTVNATTGLLTITGAGSIVVSTNIAGGPNGSSTVTVIADATPPTVSVTSPSVGMVVSTANITVSGNAGDAATATVVVNGGAPIALTLDGSGNFNSVLLGADGLVAGRNNIVVRADDAAGNRGSSGTIEVEVNPAKPDIKITSPAEGTKTNSSTVTVTGTVSGATSATMRVNGVSVGTVGLGSFSKAITIKEGKNTIVVSGYDTATGTKLGTSGIRTVIRDTVKPVVTITAPTSGSQVNTAGVNIQGTVDDPAVTQATLTLNGGAPISVPVVGGAFSQDVVLASGSNSVSVTAADPLGNTSVAATATITYDNTKPTVTITAPTNNSQTNTGGQTVTGTVNDLSITTATLIVNGVSQTIAVAPDGSFSKTVSLSTGLNSIEARAVDGAGNSGTSGVVRVTLDVTPPKVKVLLSDPTDSVIVTVTSNEPLGAAPTMGGTAGTPTMTQTGPKEWTGVLNSVLAGTRTVTAIGTDRAGNQGATATASYTTDTVTTTGNVTDTVTAGNTTLEIDTTDDVAGESISVTQYTGNLAENAGGGASEAGIFLDIVASGNLSDNVESIYVRVNYDEDEIYALGLDESTLKLYTVNPATGLWEAVPGSASNVTGNFVYGTLTHLSKFGAFGQELAPPAPAPQEPVTGPPAIISDVTVTGLSSDTTLRITSTGRTISSVTLTTADAYASLGIAANTLMLDADGEPLGTLTASIDATPPAAPAGMAVVSAYDFGPDGATFDPGITLTMLYDPDTLPAGADESTMYIAYYDGSQWVALDSVVDTVANSITATITHFTKFAIMSEAEEEEVIVEPYEPQATASFTISDLSISPSSVEIGGLVTIKVLVTNKGEASGKYTVKLNLNGTVVEEREVSLGAGESTTVTFTTTRNTAGTYSVSIGDLTGSFTVKAKAEEKPVEEKPIEEKPVVEEGGGLAAWVWVIIGLAVVAVAVAAYWWIRRRQLA